MDTTEWLQFHFSLSCLGEGTGNPLQCSCLENPRDGGAWWAAVYGVTQSRTRMKWLCSSIAINVSIFIKIRFWESCCINKITQGQIGNPRVYTHRHTHRNIHMNMHVCIHMNFFLNIYYPKSKYSINIKGSSSLSVIREIQINNTRHILHTYQTERNFKSLIWSVSKDAELKNSNIVLQRREITVLQERPLGIK